MLFLESKLFKNSYLSSFGEIILNFIFLLFSIKDLLLSSSKVLLSKKNYLLIAPANSLSWPEIDSTSNLEILSNSSKSYFSSGILLFNLFYYSIILAINKLGTIIKFSIFLINCSSFGFHGFLEFFDTIMSYKTPNLVLSSPSQYSK